MKQAISELSTAVIAVISVAILIAFFYFTIWPILDNNFKSQTACDKAVCSTDVDNDGMVSCNYKGQSFRCKFKG